MMTIKESKDFLNWLFFRRKVLRLVKEMGGNCVVHDEDIMRLWKLGCSEYHIALACVTDKRMAKLN